MTLAQDPIPQESLPPGWFPVDHGDERFVYRRSELPVELIATRTEADRSHPALGLGQCWELRFRHSVGDLPTTVRIGRVSTRTAAADGLLECMRRLHDRLENPVDPTAIRAVLDGIRLRDFVPDNWSVNAR